MKPILITGAGVVSAIGLNKAETYDSLINEQTGIGKLRYLLTGHKEFPVGEVKLSDDQMKDILAIAEDVPTTRTFLMATIAMKEALAEARLLDNKSESVGLVSGTTVGGMDKSERFYLDYLENDSRNAYIKTHDCGACTEMTADYFGIFDVVTSISTACSSAANAIILGANLIRTGQSEIVVVGGSECITKFHLNGFKSLMILDGEQCRPFDNTRNGLNLGEGASYLVLETPASARRRGVKAIGMLSGYGNACDAFHQTASSSEGEGSYLAMSKALKMSGFKVSDIQYINAHGTGTPNNDASESSAIKRLFGNDVPAISSTKSFTGHTTSASGSIEATICLLALQHQFLPINLNWHEAMEDGIIPVTNKRPSGELRNVMCNAFGFGGNDSSIILSSVGGGI